jgi:hypothetical protein
MPVSAEVLTIIIAILTTVFGGAWALYKFVRALDKKASLKAKEVDDNKIADRLKSIEHEQEVSKSANEKALKEAKAANVKSIENMGERLKLEQDKLMIRVDYLEKEVDNISTKQSQDHTKHDEIISDIREVLADIRETIAGFGKDFVTRREFLDSKRRDRDV